MKTIKIKIILFTLLFCGCESERNQIQNEFDQNMNNRVNANINTLNYYQDGRTKLCFAAYETSSSNIKLVFTNVPCTKEVEKLIQYNLK